MLTFLEEGESLFLSNSWNCLSPPATFNRISGKDNRWSNSLKTLYSQTFLT